MPSPACGRCPATRRCRRASLTRGTSRGGGPGPFGLIEWIGGRFRSRPGGRYGRCRRWWHRRRWEGCRTRYQRLALGWFGRYGWCRWGGGRCRRGGRFRCDSSRLCRGAGLEAGKCDLQRSKVTLQLERMLACLARVATGQPGPARYHRQHDKPKQIHGCSLIVLMALFSIGNNIASASDTRIAVCPQAYRELILLNLPLLAPASASLSPPGRHRPGTARCWPGRGDGSGG